jgi:hypothetical protein
MALGDVHASHISCMKMQECCIRIFLKIKIMHDIVCFTSKLQKFVLVWSVLDR